MTYVGEVSARRLIAPRVAPAALLLLFVGFLAVTSPAGAAPEVEPNDGQETATPVSVVGTTALNGTTLAANDTVDYFTIVTSTPVVLWVNLTSGWSCTFSCEELAVQYGNGSVVVDQFGDELSGESVEFFLPASTAYYLRVGAGTPGGPYTISIERRTASVAANAKIPVLAGEADGKLSVLAWGSYDGPSLPLGFDLGASGNGTIYDDCLIFSILNDEPVPVRVFVPAGLRLDPLDSDVGRYIVTRDQTFEVPAWTVKEFHVVAAGESEQGAIASDGTIFFLDGMATGRLGQITTATRAGNYSARSEAVALWSGNGNLTRSELVDWRASEASITEGGRILTAAGVQTDINPPPPPPNTNTNSNSATGGAASSSLPLYLGLGLGLVVLIAIGAAVSRKRKAAAGQATTIFGPGGPAVPGQPGAPVQPTQSPYGSAYAPSAPSPYAPSPAGPPGTEGLYAQRQPAYGQPAPAYSQPYASAPYYAPAPSNVETVYVDEPACPKCNTAKQQGSTFCLQCGEFFVK